MSFFAVSVSEDSLKARFLTSNQPERSSLRSPMQPTIDPFRSAMNEPSLSSAERPTLIRGRYSNPLKAPICIIKNDGSSLVVRFLSTKSDILLAKREIDNKRAQNHSSTGPVVEPGPRRGPSEPKIVGSNPTGPAILLYHQKILNAF
jgi:hypothetical protein